MLQIVIMNSNLESESDKPIDVKPKFTLNDAMNIAINLFKFNIISIKVCVKRMHIKFLLYFYLLI